MNASADLTPQEQEKKERRLKALGKQETKTSRLAQLISAFETGGSAMEPVYHSDSEVSERDGARKREKSLSGASSGSGTKPPMKRTYRLILDIFPPWKLIFQAIQILFTME